MQKDQTTFPYKHTKKINEEESLPVFEDPQRFQEVMQVVQLTTKALYASEDRTRNFQAVSKVVSVLHALTEKKQYEKVIPKATEVISNIMNEAEEDKAINNNLLYLYHLRARCFCYLNKDKEVIDDATAALDLLPCFLKSSIILEGGELEPDFFQDLQSKFLILRGVSSERLGDLDGAVLDYRTSLAISRTTGKYNEARPILQALVRAMALLKLGKPRPHYTEVERRSWHKELRLKEFSRDRYRCLSCCAPPAAGLKLCGGCSRVWFCGKECQRAAWRQHRGSCAPGGLTLTVMPSVGEAETRANIAARGYSPAVATGGDDPAVLMQDPVTGGVFESLSDQVRGNC